MNRPILPPGHPHPGWYVWEHFPGYFVAEYDGVPYMEWKAPRP